MSRLFFYFLIFLVGSSASAQQPKELTGVDPYVKRVMELYQVPGLALAVVKDGKILLSEGYGVRSVKAADPVDEHTLFGIASNSKAFTAAALALLVEEGKIEWDTPVIHYLPWFSMSDPLVTRQITVRDLLVHHSGLGLGAGDLLLWPATTYSRREIAERLRNVPLAYPFRSKYAYDNVLYLVAGVLIEEVSGMRWEKFIQTQLFDPLGMQHSAPSVYSIVGGNLAATHILQNGMPTVVPHDTSSNANPAGGIGSCAADMARWMQVLLDSGRISKDLILFSPARTSELWSPVTPLPMRDPGAGLEALRMNYRAYALGFRVNDFRGKQVVSHTGTLTGYVSRMFLIPELKLGIAVLTNQESTDAYESIIYRIADRFLGQPDYDWAQAFLNASSEDKEDLGEKAPVRPTGKSYLPAPLPLQSYCRLYQDKWYGDIRIENRGGRLWISFLHTPQLQGKLEHWQNNSFVARWAQRDLRADAFVSFILGPEGMVERVTMKAFLPGTDFSYDFQDLDLRPVKE